MTDSRQILAIQSAVDPPRLSIEEATILYDEAEFSELLHAGLLRRRSMIPGNEVTYLVDRNVNYTNVCTINCQFCSFYRPPGHAETYTQTIDEISHRFSELEDIGGTQLPEAPFQPSSRFEEQGQPGSCAGADRIEQQISGRRGASGKVGLQVFQCEAEQRAGQQDRQPLAPAAVGECGQSAHEQESQRHVDQQIGDQIRPGGVRQPVPEHDMQRVGGG